MQSTVSTTSWSVHSTISPDSRASISGISSPRSSNDSQNSARDGASLRSRKQAHIASTLGTMMPGMTKNGRSTPEVASSRRSKQRRRRRRDAVSTQSDDDGEERFETSSLTFALRTSAPSASAAADLDANPRKRSKQQARGNPMKDALRAALAQEEQRLSSERSRETPSPVSSAKQSGTHKHKHKQRSQHVRHGSDGDGDGSSPSSSMEVDRDPKLQHRQAREGRVILEKAEQAAKKSKHGRGSAVAPSRSARASRGATNSKQHVPTCFDNTATSSSTSSSSSSVAGKLLPSRGVERRRRERRTASDRLKGAKFRMLNELWPVNPLDDIIAYVKRRPRSAVVADFGCGEARLSQSVPNVVHSFDLVACNENVTACDIANVPLEDETVDIAVFCLALMGTNYPDYLAEAHRVLRLNGTLKIAEVKSRILKTDDFIGIVSRLGFEFVSMDDSNKMFVSFEFTKSTRKRGSVPPKMAAATLQPCIYKRR
ncbi:hypothetical protein PTSG_05089 [Salpingoeca rosetta]|uniref:Ribosomal RNA-processing protein 8 n=1 Tax=Salpingoeca rosetta (strain ATCC 50818 / BSB-021) TaxID=946362 RepID=F2UAH8_SALR5|nr:uncharacterized protein PTSG_05089 [Salpingoeca rosetta]EGD73394.1 hypothetical protein PTSG_05089 [Salpingoeca rosetta]|eukprot:XP_004993676.1 hypothetical protein PTSG_05089 [Salpingoeca rosetta]